MGTRLLGAWSGIVCALVLLAACNSQKEPAQAAFAQVQASVTPVSADLEKYAPAEFEKLSALIDDMKAKLNAKDYAGALALRSDVMAQLATTSGAVGQRKNELSKQFAGEWKELKTDVPNLLSRLASRVNYLQGGGKLPADVSAGALQQAAQAVAELNVEWTAAMDAMRSRDTDTAVMKAEAIKKRGAEVGAMLAMQSG